MTWKEDAGYYNNHTYSSYSNTYTSTYTPPDPLKETKEVLGKIQVRNPETTSQDIMSLIQNTEITKHLDIYQTDVDNKKESFKNLSNIGDIKDLNWYYQNHRRLKQNQPFDDSAVSDIDLSVLSTQLSTVQWKSDNAFKQLTLKKWAPISSLSIQSLKTIFTYGKRVIIEDLEVTKEHCKTLSEARKLAGDSYYIDFVSLENVTITLDNLKSILELSSLNQSIAISIINDKITLIPLIPHTENILHIANTTKTQTDLDSLLALFANRKNKDVGVRFENNSFHSNINLPINISEEKESKKQSLPRLTGLNITSQIISPEIVDSLTKQLETENSLVRFSLSNAAFKNTDDKSRLLITLFSSKNIEHTSLVNCALTDTDIQTISTALKNNTKLKTLDLRGNKFSSNALKVLSETILNNNLFIETILLDSQDQQCLSALQKTLNRNKSREMLKTKLQDTKTTLESKDNNLDILKKCVDSAKGLKYDNFPNSIEADAFLITSENALYAALKKEVEAKLSEAKKLITLNTESKEVDSITTTVIKVNDLNAALSEIKLAQDLAKTYGLKNEDINKIIIDNFKTFLDIALYETCKQETAEDILKCFRLALSIATDLHTTCKTYSPPVFNAVISKSFDEKEPKNILKYHQEAIKLLDDLDEKDRIPLLKYYIATQVQHLQPIDGKINTIKKHIDSVFGTLYNLSQKNQSEQLDVYYSSYVTALARLAKQGNIPEAVNIAADIYTILQREISNNKIESHTTKSCCQELTLIANNVFKRQDITYGYGKDLIRYLGAIPTERQNPELLAFILKKQEEMSVEHYKDAIRRIVNVSFNLTETVQDKNTKKQESKAIKLNDKDATILLKNVNVSDSMKSLVVHIDNCLKSLNGIWSWRKSPEQKELIKQLEKIKTQLAEIANNYAPLQKVIDDAPPIYTPSTTTSKNKTFSDTTESNSSSSYSSSSTATLKTPSAPSLSSSNSSSKPSLASALTLTLNPSAPSLNVTEEKETRISKKMKELKKLGVDPDKLTDLHDYYKCPITLGIMSEPVTADDGLFYDRSSADSMIKHKKCSPQTGKPITSYNSSITLENGILEYLDNKINELKQKKHSDISTTVISSSSSSISTTSGNTSSSTPLPSRKLPSYDQVTRPTSSPLSSSSPLNSSSSSSSVSSSSTSAQNSSNKTSSNNNKRTLVYS